MCSKQLNGNFFKSPSEKGSKKSGVGTVADPAAACYRGVSAVVGAVGNGGFCNVETCPWGMGQMPTQLVWHP